MHAYPAQLPVLAELLPSIQTPVQIFAGRTDEVVPLANAEHLDRHLPDSRLDVIDAGHFAWEEKAADFARIITEFWAKH